VFLSQITRRDYRELFYTAPGIGHSISGAILFKETLYQSASSGKPFVECLQDQGILPGIKVDEGLVPITATDGETGTRGLDGLAANSAAWRR
jgi:fructose-bisphosphate aldolase class I